MTFESPESPIDHGATDWETRTPEYAERPGDQMDVPTGINPEQGQGYDDTDSTGQAWQAHDILPTEDRTGDGAEGDDDAQTGGPARFIPRQRQSEEVWNPDDAYEDDEPGDNSGEPPFLPPLDPPTGGNGEGDGDDSDGDDEGDDSENGEDVPIDPTLFIPGQRPSAEGSIVGETAENAPDTEPATEQPSESDRTEGTDQPEIPEEHIEPTLEAGTSQRFSYDDGPEEVEYGGGEIIIPSDNVVVARSGEGEEGEPVTLTAVNDGSHIIAFHHSVTGESALVNITAAGTSTMQEVSEELVGHLLESTPALGKAGVTLTILGEQNPQNIESTESAGVAGVGDELRGFLSMQLPKGIVLPEPADIPNGSNIRVNAETGDVTAIDQTGRQVYPPIE
jgi:hypothetical protein